VTIGRHGHRGDTVLDAQSVDQLAVEDIPQTNGLVTTARSNVTTVAGKVQRVDILLVAAEDMLDGACSNIPNL
jgi:hypothetical protein